MNAYKEMDRLTVAEAAERLGVKEQAIRKRIQRGTIVHDKDEDGRVYVYADSYEDTDPNAGERRTSTDTNTSTHTLVESMQDQIDTLKNELEIRNEELRRKDTIIMTMAQRIPELEPASEPRESPETATPEAEGVEAPLAEKTRPWWRRFFDLYPGVVGAHTEEIQRPYSATYRRARRPRECTRDRRDAHTGLYEGTSYSDPLGLPRGRSLDRGSSPRMPRRRIPRFRGRC